MTQKRILLIDDLRSVEEAVKIAKERYPAAHEISLEDDFIIARDLDDAIDLIAGCLRFDAYLVDHDLGALDTDGADAMEYLYHTCLENPYKVIPEHVFAVSSNPVGIKKINAWAKDFKKLKGAREDGN